MRGISVTHTLVRVLSQFCWMMFPVLVQSHSYLAVHMTATLVTVLIQKMLGSDAKQVSFFTSMTVHSILIHGPIYLFSMCSWECETERELK